jgi:hypothetical protein
MLVSQLNVTGGRATIDALAERRDLQLGDAMDDVLTHGRRPKSKAATG